MKRIKIVNDKVYLYEGVKRVRKIKTLKDYHNVMELREDYWARLDKFYVELDINKREVYIEDDFNGVGFLLNELENGTAVLEIDTGENEKQEMTIEELHEALKFWQKWNDNPYKVVEEFIDDNHDEFHGVPPVPRWY